MKTTTCFLYALLCLTVVLVQGYEIPEFCLEQPEEGPCGNSPPSIPKWYFEPRRGDCGRFLWGGCAGDNNNFPNCTLCMSTCGGRQDAEEYCRHFHGSA
uniref:Putative kunitz-like protease inhibitor n=1 Tax=Amblyomma cajennense TaxID=34607 RepID=A0A023FSQ9_AMBCJ